MGSRTRTNSTSGQACIEMAIALLVLIPMLLGVYDFAIRASNSISNMSREGANMASRLPDRRQDIMNALAVTAQPLDMKANGMIYITQLQGDKIVSQVGWQSGDLNGVISSRIGTPTAAEPTPVAHGVNAALGPTQTAYVVEVFYNYHSLFSSSGLLGRQLYAKSLF